LGTPEGKRQLGRTKRGWKYNIKNGSSKNEIVGMYWIIMVQDTDRRLALVNAVIGT
jgi:hypothetical protein